MIGKDMKTTDLMLGDYLYCVQDGEKYVATVTKVNKQTVEALVSFRKKDTGYIYTLYVEGIMGVDFQPIPITEEFLEVNGWHKLDWKDVKYHPGISAQYKHDWFLDTLRISYNDMMHHYYILDDEISHLKYVNELQHVFHLINTDFDFSVK